MSASARADEEGRKVFLGGLSFDAREDDLRADFEKYGELVDVQLPMGDGGKHKGFAFLTYFKADDAREACKEHHQKPYMGREISAKVVVPREQRGGDRGGSGAGRELPQLSQEMNDKLEEWVAAKRRRDFETADRLRSEMKDAGFNPEEYRPKPSDNGGSGRFDDRRGGDRFDDRRGGDRYDDRRGGGRYDDRRGSDRYDDRHGGDRYNDRRGGDRYDDRGRGDRYDDRRGGDSYDDRRSDDRYDDRRSGDRYSERRSGDRHRQRSYSPDRRRDDRRDLASR